jgi:hypothetical protein
MKSKITHGYQDLDLKFKQNKKIYKDILLNMEDNWLITETSKFAYDMHVITSRSWLVKGQEVHIHVCCGRGFSYHSDCLVNDVLPL